MGDISRKLEYKTEGITKKWEIERFENIPY